MLSHVFDLVTQNTSWIYLLFGVYGGVIFTDTDGSKFAHFVSWLCLTRADSSPPKSMGSCFFLLILLYVVAVFWVYGISPETIDGSKQDPSQSLSSLKVEIRKLDEVCFGMYLSDLAEFLALQLQFMTLTKSRKA